MEEAALRDSAGTRTSVQSVTLLASTLLLLGLPLGCLSKPPSQSEILTDALPEGTSVPGGWSAGGARGDVGDDWLESFGDPAVVAIVADAIANNTDLRQAAARVEAVRQGVKLADSRLLPQVGINIGLGATRDDRNDDWFTSTKGLAGVAWEPDVWGRLRAKRASAEADYETAALDYTFARQSLAATTAVVWYRTTETRKLLELARESVETFSELFELVKRRRAAGRVDDLDVAAASANVNAAEGALRQARAAAAESSRHLEILVGRYPAAKLRAGIDFPSLSPLVQAGLPSSLLERRPDIVAAERQVLSAFRMKEASELALLPSFALNLNAGRLSDNLLSVLQVNPWMFTAAIGMYVPIYTGGALRAQIKISTARQQRAVAAYGSTALASFREVENGLMNEELLAQRLQFAKNVLHDHTEAVRIASLQYQAGSMSLLWVLQLQSEQIASRAELIQLQYAQLANRINLHLALGGGFDTAPTTGATSAATE